MALTDKEAVLFLTRLAALDNVMLAVGPSREQWQKSFLDLLYTMCTKVVPPHVSCSLCYNHLPSNYIHLPSVVEDSIGRGRQFCCTAWKCFSATHACMRCEEFRSYWQYNCSAKCNKIIPLNYGSWPRARQHLLVNVCIGAHWISGVQVAVVECCLSRPYIK